MRSLVSAVATLAAFVALAVLQTWPLPRHLDTHLPGLGLGDNVSFVWNLWWMREAVASPALTFLSSPVVFAPLGAPLVLHTHTAALAWIGATLLSHLSVVSAQNVLLIASIALNGWSVSLLARAVTGHTAASFLAGAMFLVSPVIATRLAGHFNLVAAWPLVFACLAFVLWWRRFDRVHGIALGLAAGLLPFFDYYLSVYFLVFVMTAGVATSIQVDVRRTRRMRMVLPLIAAILALAAIAAATAIAMASGDAFELLGVRVSARSPTNALTVAWAAGLVAWLGRWRWTCAVRGTSSRTVQQIARAAVLPLVVAALLISPLIVPAWRLVQEDGYVTQQSGLRSGPRGVDAATLVIGPPFHGLLGAAVRDADQRFGIDPIESSAYVGWVALMLAAWAWTRRRDDSRVREWGIVFAVFAIWAFGPYLMVFGRNTGLLLPGALLRVLPIVNNARIPGRGLIPMSIAMSVLAGCAIGSLGMRGRFGLYVLLGVAAIGESLAAPLPLTALPAAGVYAHVALDRSATTVLPVPFGLRDGFGERGRVEPDAIFQQTRHGHPIAGGFLARLPPSIGAWYDAHEPFATLLRLATGTGTEGMPPCETSRMGLQSAGVGYVVLYADASASLRQFVATLPLEQADADAQRVLYRVTRCQPE